MALGRLENFIKRYEVEMITVFPEGRRSDGTWVDVIVSVLNSDGVQKDFSLTPSELKDKKRLRKLYRLIRRLGILLLDDYEIISPTIAGAGGVDNPGGLR